MAPGSAVSANPSSHLEALANLVNRMVSSSCEPCSTSAGDMINRFSMDGIGDSAPT
jgi:hypothetical protein